jgi:dihydroflavonol-4-reductase
MENIDLVTGASGLLGSNLVRQLCIEGRRVRILVRKSSAVAHLTGLPYLETVVGDVTDLSSIQQAMQGVEYVYHCAARVSIQRKIFPLDWQTNVVGTENMILAAKSVGIERMIHCSSVDAIGLPTGPLPANEDIPWNWDLLGLDNAYARTKYESHQRVVEAAKKVFVAKRGLPGFFFFE